MKAILFDFDGVIHDTFEFHRKKVKDFSGISLSKEDYRDMHKKNFYLNTPEEFKNVNWKGYGEFICNDISLLKIKKETREAILKLGEKSILFVVTSGEEKNVSDYLGNNGIINNFEEVLGRKASKSKVDKFKYIFEKYKLETSDCIFITDTLGDIMEANEIGLKTIAVDFGFHCRETLEEGKPYKIISSFGEIVSIIEKI
ncbi:MAG: HAD hydrolase-like protein [Patescibacteria group bacterium]|jgi:HAD superfamily hydrolase (TIGR01509 family)|nr:HAD hydrolase-like protein [Patescibacteria group bacterium]